ncbi:DUF1775 domain-containing protein [Phreatobacter oligotrophus]|uniref:YncI copper-binding domain-containing protein n=1 Tax=Phreatobacter oligotrophus TaxID=1122261 RepID=A0A2T4YXR7_9HYPH|nr:DUF1775 domain-containing protein [Phreatobacter oligotrophus]PTM51143.1 hypothetical protein C8P69_11171 [Phreatobacter oligotrophus]
MSRLFPAALLALIVTSPATAHITLETGSTAPGSYKAVLRVPHGCGTQATTGITVTIPEGVHSVKPQPKPGWTLATTVRPYQRTYTNHGREVRQGVQEIRWSGGSLPNEHYDEFVFIGQIDASLATAGTVHFPVVQTCAGGEHRWTEIPAAGSQARLASPAPSLRIVAAAAPAPATVQHGALRIGQAWTRATPGGARVAGGYLTVTNTGTTPDRLVGGAAAFAERVEIHEMATQNGVMTMRPITGGLAIAPGQTVELKPGGLHVMFMGLNRPLAEGQSVTVTLEFETAGKIDINLAVGGLGARSAPAGEHHHH